MGNQYWKLKTTAVYHTIVDENDGLICFMSISEKDLQNAMHIINLHNGTSYKEKAINRCACHRCLGIDDPYKETEQ